MVWVWVSIPWLRYDACWSIRATWRGWIIEKRLRLSFFIICAMLPKSTHPPKNGSKSKKQIYHHFPSWHLLPPQKNKQRCADFGTRGKKAAATKTHSPKLTLDAIGFLFEGWLSIMMKKKNLHNLVKLSWFRFKIASITHWTIVSNNIG